MNPDTAPAVWMTAAYFADARRYPEVQEYFTRFRRFLQEMDTTEMPVIQHRMELRMLQSGLSKPMVEEATAGVHATLMELAPDRRRRSEDMLAMVAGALDLHAFLVGVDSRVHLDEEADIARFLRPDEQRRATEMIREVERLMAVVEGQRAASRGRMRDVRGLFNGRADSAVNKD
ncbi:MAG TPA: hypothetical protein VHG08_21640 [Longimicrobium sp.]|nr:hypothetical protein [Longimicrobium sp.]